MSLVIKSIRGRRTSSMMSKQMMYETWVVSDYEGVAKSLQLD